MLRSCDQKLFVKKTFRERLGGSVITFLATTCFCVVFWSVTHGAMAANGIVEIVVVKNDTLISLCKTYLQNPAQWPEVGRINHLKNMDVLKPGQKLLVPVEFLRGVPMKGRVVFVRSDALVKEAGRSQWKPLQLNQVVSQGSSIKTGSNAAVEIAFDNGSSFFQQPDTTLSLESTQIKQGEHVFQRFVLAVGRIIMKVRHATGKDSRIEIRTPSATAVARGTDFRVAVGKDANTWSEVLQGVIDVEGARRNVMVQEGEGTAVKKGFAPSPPRKLLQPPSLLELQKVYREMPFTLNYEVVAGAAKYRLILSRDREGKDVVREFVFASGEHPPIAGLEDGVYYCRMLSVDELGLEGAFSEPGTVVVRTNPLPPFTQEPREGVAIKGKTVDFRWLKVRDAASYQLQIADDAEFRHLLRDVADLKETDYRHQFQHEGAAYFRIRSTADDGFSGIWSDKLSFTLVPPPPAPEMEKPSQDNGKIHIRFRGLGAGFRYHVQVARSEQFSELVLDRVVDIPELALDKPSATGVYYVRTSSVDSDGFEGPFSPFQSFEIKSWWPYYSAGGALGIAGIVLLILL